MDFMKKTLNQVNVHENTLYNIFYDLFFFAKLQESEDSVKNGRVCTLEELKQHIEELEANFRSSSIENEFVKNTELFIMFLKQTILFMFNTYFVQDKIQIYF